MAAALSFAFYGVMFAALAYFLHRIAWLSRYRALSRRMVKDALDELSEREAESLGEFERHADSSWSAAEAAKMMQQEPPDAYIRRIEANLEQVRGLLESSEHAATPAFVAAVAEGRATDEPLLLLRVPRLLEKAEKIQLPLDFPRPRALAAPAEDLYALELRSRYGLLPRALAFFLGAADVVYSTHHVTQMGQSAHVPTGLILRRLSLVAVVLGAVLLDIALGARRWLIEVAETQLAGAHVPAGLPFSHALQSQLGTLVGLGVWLAAYGALYFGLYLFLRRRSHARLRQLTRMRTERLAQVEAMEQARSEELARWAESYGATLDGQVHTSALLAQMLTGRAIQRLRRRLAPEALLTTAERIAETLFTRLPESRHDLSGGEPTKKPSFAHALWPRPEEMGHGVRLAQYREAFRQLSHAATELRAELPDPSLARELWSASHRFAVFFQAMLPEDVAKQLRESYDATLSSLPRETEADLAELDTHLAELASSLRQRLEVVAELVESRIELAQQAGEAEVARLAAEVLRVREAARLEAMAFEI
ncbi:MAG: hypothetical protein GXP55_06675 [Deltaproteobacteria bacterium]|nr:hypothetical protein [Deltaproteobacteria bacterium]